jgi:hypothetical protein
LERSGITAASMSPSLALAISSRLGKVQ